MVEPRPRGRPMMGVLGVLGDSLFVEMGLRLRVGLGVIRRRRAARMDPRCRCRYLRWDSMV
jgi:hypothetical protein